MTSETASYQVLMFPAKDLPDRYLNMILSKWLRSLKFSNDYFKLIDNDSFFAHYNVFIRRILSLPDTQVRLAVLSDDDDVVLGWSVSRGEILDYVHVHKNMRKIGIGSALIPDRTKSVTHMTRPAMAIWQSKYSHFVFNPFQ